MEPPPWDPEADELPCPYGTVSAPLFDAVLTDAGLDPSAVGYTEDDWSHASYARYLDDDFRLSWFYDYQWNPMTYPCLGEQVAADLDFAAANPHPVASALGVAMERLGTARVLDPIAPEAAHQDLVDLSGLPEDLAQALVPVIQAMEAVAEARQAMADAAPCTLTELVNYGHGGVVLDFSSAPDLTDRDARDWVLDPTVGPHSLEDPARVLAFAVEEANLGRFLGTDATLDQDTDLGRFIVAGPGEDAPGDLGYVAFYLDLGGNDTYVHSAGASSVTVPVSVHIDLGGDDTYGYTEEDGGSEGLLPADSAGRYAGDGYYGAFSLSKVGRQGSGRGGVGLLFDLGAGNDQYTTLRMGQGWGHSGVGVLYDDGGDDVYQAEDAVHGGASMGIGLLLDQGGDDVHRTFVNSQGFAYVQAVGIAWDGGGTDTWYANPGSGEGGVVVYYSPQMPGTANSSMSQGSGFGRRGDTDGTFLSGGLGVLRDAGGDDTYTAGLFAQGAGYWQSVGLLLDGGGADAYDAFWYVQGGAAHYSAGVLLDDGPGDDVFNGTLSPVNMQQGAGHDFSVGVLVNEEGNDTYHYGSLAAGASNCQGFGLFVDNDGSDTYQIGSEYSTGLGNHSSECESESRTAVDSIGLFLDSGGDPDTYAWPEGSSWTAPADDSSFGRSWNGTPDEFGGGVDGDGETSAHAGP